MIARAGRAFFCVTKQKINQETISFREARILRMEALLEASNYVIFHILPDQRLVELRCISPTESVDLNITNYVAIHSALKEHFLANAERCATA